MLSQAKASRLGSFGFLDHRRANALVARICPWSLRVGLASRGDPRTLYYAAPKSRVAMTLWARWWPAFIAHTEVPDVYNRTISNPSRMWKNASRYKLSESVASDSFPESCCRSFVERRYCRPISTYTI